MFKIKLGVKPDWAKFATIEVHIIWNSHNPSGEREGKHKEIVTQRQTFLIDDPKLLELGELT